MKRMVIVGIVVAMIGLTAMCGFAQPVSQEASGKSVAVKGKLVTLFGTVVSLDAATRQMVVTEEKSGQNMTFTVSKKAAGVVKAGHYVRIAVREGSTTAGGVWITKKKSTVLPVALPIDTSVQSAVAGTTVSVSDVPVTVPSGDAATRQ